MISASHVDCKGTIVNSVTTASSNFSNSLWSLAETHGLVDSINFGVYTDKSICFKTEGALQIARIDIGIGFISNHKQQHNEKYMQLPIPFLPTWYQFENLTGIFVLHYHPTLMHRDGHNSTKIRHYDIVRWMTLSTSV